MSDEALRPTAPLVVLPLVRLNPVTLATLVYARSLTDNVLAVHAVAGDDVNAPENLESTWHKWTPDVPLMVVDGPCRSAMGLLLSYIDTLQRQQPDRVLTVVIPEIVSDRWWDQLIHTQSALRLKGALLFRSGIIVTGVPNTTARRPAH